MPSPDVRRFSVLRARAPSAQGRSATLPTVRSIIGWLGAFVLGSVGWWLGAKVGLGTGVVLGTIGSGGGLWAGFRWFDENLK
jgi:hypothetical protein